MKRKMALFLIDISLTFFAGVVALFVRLGFDWPELAKYFLSIPIYCTIAAIVYIANGTYKIVWLYASFKDMVLLMRGTIIAYLLNVVFFHLTNFVVLPRSVGMMTFLGSTMILIASRFFWQWLNTVPPSAGKRVLIVGAGSAGTMLLEDFEHRPQLGKVVGFIDDSPRKIGRKIHGVPVYGPADRAMEIVEMLKIDEVIIAIPSATAEQMRRIISLINPRRVKIRTLPGIYELTDGQARVGSLREIKIEDLLGREEVKVDLQQIKSYINGKRIMVTGAGGSIGSELCRQLSKLEPSTLILLGKGENSIYKIDEELRVENPSVERIRVIADISDPTRMEQVFRLTRPQIVFHAAAHKHVPLMEENPYEALKVNTLGTKIVAELCCKFEAEKMIFISTDKAVNPSSIMGATKRLAELLLLSMNQGCKTNFVIVRFGNVIGSRGSVVPKFMDQISKGGPVTVTDQRMVRYFMSLSEAVSLVLQAGSFGTNKDLFVLDMGKPISIDELARTMILLNGLIPEQDIKIVYTGSRSGEKMSEELFYEDEFVEATKHPKVKMVKTKKKIAYEELCKSLEEMIKLSIDKPGELIEYVKRFLRSIEEGKK
ncbi:MULTISPECIES: polysaccharide biosynthesis protein [Pseudothermotoga]|uniref:polysaccharide biosynthesis protein n=1 Tax=Pseudothermotoga TaxID=1643951 RepID=UPI000428E8C9|nr:MULTISPECIES: nucleoside-diphosphate sugar epimerase/dehydratase [Pseudothermotoga]HBJ80669.1 polysaccharide biosynthesis protein [Pseudothermotoga sp.]HBT26902.1 polysaccharide biosynthesis protein [Pseudothermotoga sp.]